MAAVRAKPRHSRDELLFGGSLAHRSLMIAASGACAVVVCARWSQSERWETAALLALSVALLIAFPPTIVLTATGIDRRLWWRKTNRIPWNDISSIQRNPVGDYTVYGQQQPPIFYSRYYVDATKFAFEVARRAKLKISDSQEPIRVAPR